MNVTFPVLIFSVTTMLSRLDVSPDVSTVAMTTTENEAYDVTADVTSDEGLRLLSNGSNTGREGAGKQGQQGQHGYRPSKRRRVPLGRAKPIRNYGMPVITAIGIPSNVCSFLLMQRQRLRVTSVSVYFSTLAVADTWVLLHAISYQWSSSYFGTTFWLKHNILCVLNQWTLLFGMTWAAWLVVALTVERLLVIIFPLRSKVWCTRRNAVITVISITLISASVWAVLVFMWGVEMSIECQIRDLINFLEGAGYTINAILYSLGPSSLLLLLNGALVYQLWKAQKQRAQMASNAAVSDDSNAKRTSTTIRVTITVCVVSISYLLFTLPISMFRLLDRMRQLTDEGPVIVSQVAILFRLLNHSVNFFIYLLTSDRMREEFVALMMCRNIRQKYFQTTKSKKTVSTTAKANRSER